MGSKNSRIVSDRTAHLGTSSKDEVSTRAD